MNTINHSLALNALNNRQPFAALLFDMDGTLLNSTAVFERLWQCWCHRHHLDLTKVVAAAHGRRTRDTVYLFCPEGIDADAEADELIAQEEADVAGIVAVGGAAPLLAQLSRQQWAVVTSANRLLAQNRLAAAGLPMPDLLISAEDVNQGKPDPEGYLLAAKMLGVDPARCLVIEDAPAGVAAALAARASVLVITEVHAHELPHNVATVTNFSGFKVSMDDSGVWLDGV